MAEPATFVPPKLGIGMTFSVALQVFLQRRPESLQFLEIEPQTLWLADDALEGPFFEYAVGIDAIAGLPGRKLVHSVGVPLGGTRAPNPAQMALLSATAKRFDSPWVSEHLSVAGTPHRSAGFLLPPLQTDEGIGCAVRNISAFAQGVGRPIAVETGVAYFQRKAFEMKDGAFVADVVAEADCGILLDLHNLYCNQRNGRISIDDFMSDLPLDRVWEMHLAGGTEMDGFWLDSHSGPMPDELVSKALEIVTLLPNLGAINFEIYDTFLDQLSAQDFDHIVEDLQQIWSKVAGDVATKQRQNAPLIAAAHASSPDVSAPDWERTVTDAVWKANPALHPWNEDQAPLRLYSKLARSFRSSMLTRSMPRSIRYLLLRDGLALERQLGRYFSSEDPKLYAPLEATAFQAWLLEDGETDPLAIALIDYDMAFMKLARDGTSQIVKFPGNPGPVFEALAERRLPELPPPPAWELEILPDNVSVQKLTANGAVS